MHTNRCAHTRNKSIQKANLCPQQEVQSTHTHVSQEVPYQFWVSGGLGGVSDTDLEQYINQLGLVIDDILERCHHGAVDVHSSVG